ncbi:MAG TPA: cytochrome c-type biogenesis CcmF C-terminal domain-containing protein, partial [Acidimicrobiia bacterium]|nr:cytochrome c-type biogenesis CcmF C-terminal domain-containing protein [Acidimicrobiia bacterium]
CAALGVRGVAELIAFGLGAFALAGIARQYYLGVASTRRTGSVGWAGALRRTVAGNRRLYGGLIVHAAVVIIAVALAASMGYTTKREAHLAVGEKATLQGYRFTYLGTRQHTTGQKNTIQARVKVQRGSKTLGVYAPALSIFPNSPNAIGTPSVRTGILRDVYLTLVSSPDDTGRVTIGVQVGPLVAWLWLGAGVLVFGTVIAIWPSRRLRRRRVETGTTAEPPPPPVPSSDEDLLEEAPA